MKTSVWSGRVKFVAVLDLIITSLCLTCGLIFALIATYVSCIVYYPKDFEVLWHIRYEVGLEEIEFSVSAISSALWILTANCVMQGAIRLLASINLLQSTTSGREAENSLTKAEFWKYTSLILLFANACVAVLIYSTYVLWIECIIRVIFLSIVENFLRELKQAPNTKNSVAIV